MFSYLRWVGILCSITCNKVPQTGWLKQRKCIVSQFWKTEVQNQSLLSWFHLRAVKEGSNPGFSLWLVDNNFFPMCLHILFLQCVSMSIYFPFL